MRELIKELKRFEPLNEQDDLTEFVETVEKIVAQKNPKCIPFLLSYMDDNSDYFDVLQTIMTLLEDFSPDEYFSKLVPLIPRMLKKSPEWLITIVERILFNPETKEIFINYMSLAPKESLYELLTRIENDWDDLAPVCEELRQKLK